MEDYKFRGFTIPADVVEDIIAYVDRRRPVGHFLEAIICNDLFEAVCRADDEALKNLPAYIGYFYNRTPGGCWGSKQKMKEWLDGPKQNETGWCDMVKHVASIQKKKEEP